MIRPGSLRFQLFVAGAISVAVALAASGFGLTRLFAGHVERRVFAELRGHLDHVVAGIDQDAAGNLEVGRPPSNPRFDQPLSGLYWQLETPGATIRSRSLWDERMRLPSDSISDGAVHQHRLRGPGPAEVLVLERRVVLPARLGGQAVRAAVGLDARDLTAATRDFAVDLLPYIALLGLFLVAASGAQIAVGLRPLAALRRRLAAVRAGTRQRLDAGLPDEVQPLASEFDALLDARDAQVKLARTRSADLAHGLRTPLQVLAGDVERLRAGGEAVIADEIEAVVMAMGRHVDREMARARMAATARADASAGVRSVIERVVAVLKRTPDGERVTWAIDVPDRLAGRIDADDLAEALGNLGENAARHARSCVAITATERDGRVVLAVTDDGPGIPPDKVGGVMDRGIRLDESGPGAGLGLSIVGEIARQWGGRLTLDSGPAGLRAELELGTSASFGGEEERQQAAAPVDRSSAH